PGRIQLNVRERALEAYEPNEAWLAVRKDLLDQQIIDTAGRKVVRVNDVDLAELRSKLPQRSIRWEFVNLIEPDPLRRVKLRITHEKLENLHPADLAEMMEE